MSALNSDKIIITIAGTVITGLLIFPYIEILDHSKRLIALEKDKEYLIQLFEERLKTCNEN
jgi:hypothetical protein